ncbi:dimethylargininase [Phytomonospora sp. NPDC050363]|uniref:dimethylargininase n=1 Tax=Phytomonospora sp. NPDC050363 TaxID=3155642 RepID=UPI0033F6AA5A
MTSRLALVRRPGPRLTEGIVTHLERTPVDAGLAAAQWDAYVEALTANGWTTLEAAPADDCPDGVFVEDTVVMFRNVAVITRPGAVARRPETPAVRAALEDLGCPVAELRGPATLDGGDVLKVGDTVYVGRGGRTNAAGVAALRALLTPLGAHVIAVPLTDTLHLKSAYTALPDGTVIGHTPHNPLFPHYLRVPEESGAHVVDLGNGRLLIATSAPHTTDLLADLGYTPVPVDISEYEKLEGCVTCLSVRLRAQHHHAER